MAELIDERVGEVEAMIALEWFGIESVIPPGVQRAAQLLDGLNEEDLALVALILGRLAADSIP